MIRERRISDHVERSNVDLTSSRNVVGIASRELGAEGRFRSDDMLVIGRLTQQGHGDIGALLDGDVGVGLPGLRLEVDGQLAAQTKPVPRHGRDDARNELDGFFFTSKWPESHADHQLGRDEDLPSWSEPPQPKTHRAGSAGFEGAAGSGARHDTIVSRSPASW